MSSKYYLWCFSSFVVPGLSETPSVGPFVISHPFYLSYEQDLMAPYTPVTPVLRRQTRASMAVEGVST